MNAIDIMRWLHEESAKSGWTGRDREKLELFMAAAYAKGRDDQEAYATANATRGTSGTST